MSRFETSKFVRNQSVMRTDCLIEACDKLGWKYRQEGNAILITDINAGISYSGEYAIKVKDNQVTYNTYYFGNTKEYVDKLRSLYNSLNVEYSKTAVISAFKKHGFTYLSDTNFKQNENEIYRFYMVGRSKNANETEPVGKVMFTIYADGTVVSDSNYLPEDVNTHAHASMDDIDLNFSSPRVMTKKEIPPEYRDRVKRNITTQVNKSKK
jgi:hypothetical protein